MVLLKILAIPRLHHFRVALHSPANWPSFCANGWPGILTVAQSFFSLTLDSIPFPPRRRMQKPETRRFPIGIIAHLASVQFLYVGVSSF